MIIVVVVVMDMDMARGRWHFYILVVGYIARAVNVISLVLINTAKATCTTLLPKLCVCNPPGTKELLTPVLDLSPIFLVETVVVLLSLINGH